MGKIAKKSKSTKSTILGKMVKKSKSTKSTILGKIVKKSKSTKSTNSQNFFLKLRYQIKLILIKLNYITLIKYNYYRIKRLN